MEYPPPVYLIVIALMRGSISVSKAEEMIALRKQKENEK